MECRLRRSSGGCRFISLLLAVGSSLGLAPLAHADKGDKVDVVSILGDIAANGTSVETATETAKAASARPLLSGGSTLIVASSVVYTGLLINKSNDLSE